MEMGHAGREDDFGDDYVLTDDGERQPSHSTAFRWPHASELDTFLLRVYSYYQGKGIYCIIVNFISNCLYA